MTITNIVQIGIAILIDLISLTFLTFTVYAEKFFRLFVPRHLKSLDGEIILVTGAGNGIGRQIALKLADVAPTATIICWDYEKIPNETIVSDLRKKNVKAYGYVLDVSDRELVTQTAAKIREEIGDVSIVFNNAGISPRGKFLDQDLNSMTRTFEINMYAHFWILREFLPKMIEKNSGHIITTASMSAFVPAREIAVYAASKHAVHGFIESLKSELRTLSVKPNINFSTVYPAIVRTRMVDDMKFYPRFEGTRVPMITPEYVAEKIVEGFRRNYEHICLPPYTMAIAFLRALLPSAIWYKIEEDIAKFDIEDVNPKSTSSLRTGNPNNTVENGPVVNGKASLEAETEIGDMEDE